MNQPDVIRRGDLKYNDNRYLRTIIITDLTSGYLIKYDGSKFIDSIVSELSGVITINGSEKLITCVDYGSAADKILVWGSDGVLYYRTTAEILSDIGAAAAAHNLLSVTHADTTAASCARGDIVTGQGVSPKWVRLALGTNGYFLKSNGTDAGWAAHGLTYTDVNAAPAAHGVTTNYLPYANSATTFANSSFIQSGTYGGIRFALFFDEGVSAAISDSVYGYIFRSTEFGSAYPFLENGNLVIQSRTTSGKYRDIVFMTGNINASVRFIIGRDGTINMSTCANAGTDTDKFLVLDSSNNIDYRTGANLLADLSGNAGATFSWNNQTIDTISTVSCTNIQISTLTAGYLPYNHIGSEILADSIVYQDSDTPASAKLGIGTAVPARRLHVNVEDSAAQEVTYVQRLSHFTTGTAANGIGTGIEFVSEDANATVNVMATIEAIETSATVHPKGELIFKTYNEAEAAGPSLAERVRIKYDGTVKLSTCIDAAADTDKFLVLDSSGYIDYRTGTEVAADIDIPSKTSGDSIQFTLYDGTTSRGTGNAWWYKRDGIFRLQIGGKTGTITATTKTTLAFDAGIIPTPISGGTIVMPGSILHNNVNAIGVYLFGATANRIEIYTGSNNYLDAGNGGAQATEFSYRYA